MKGERAVKYIFVKYKDPKLGGKNTTYAMGSYDVYNKAAREKGTLKLTERLYHLNTYSQDGSPHNFISWFPGTTEPSYDDVKKSFLSYIDR